jgi:hypothetical protein
MIVAVSVVCRALLGAGLLIVVESACDPGSLQNSGATLGTLHALALYNDAGRSHEDACSLDTSWPLPAWPATSRSDTVTVHFTRQVVLPPAAAFFRDTLLSGVVIRLDRRDSSHVSVHFGAPFTDSLVGQLDASGLVLTAVWLCPSGFPFGQDSTLLAHGYLTDSLEAGSLSLIRYTPID